MTILTRKTAAISIAVATMVSIVALAVISSKKKNEPGWKQVNLPLFIASVMGPITFFLILLLSSTILRADVFAKGVKTTTRRRYAADYI